METTYFTKVREKDGTVRHVRVENGDLYVPAVLPLTSEPARWQVVDVKISKEIIAELIEWYENRTSEVSGLGDINHEKT